MFLVPLSVGLEGIHLSKMYPPYVVEGGRPMTQSKKFTWKTIAQPSQWV